MKHTFYMLLLYIIFGVYILAVNFYAVLLIKNQKDDAGGDENKMHAGDGKLIICALLGGAVAVYVSMFIMRYRTKNMMLMILMPVIAVLNIYFIIVAFKSGFTFFAV